jgi:CrcB protein
MTPLLVAIGAALGAPARLALADHFDSERWPWGIWTANVVGSALLGMLVGLDLGSDPLALLGTGFCGAFTTFSTFAVQSCDLGQRRGSYYAASTVIGALAGVSAGFLAGQLLG